MYWDVVEVKPESNYRLFVRFKDGLTGCVELRPEELTGALAPLLDQQFFERVFIDNGAVAWPGEIDLAPDAMYAQVAGRRVIESDPETMHGVPVFSGTRVPVRTLFEYLKGGETLEDFLEGFPTVSRTVAIAALEEAKQLLLSRESAGRFTSTSSTSPAPGART